MDIVERANLVADHHLDEIENTLRHMLPFLKGESRHFPDM